MMLPVLMTTATAPDEPADGGADGDGKSAREGGQGHAGQSAVGGSAAGGSEGASDAAAHVADELPTAPPILLPR